MAEERLNGFSSRDIGRLVDVVSGISPYSGITAAPRTNGASVPDSPSAYSAAPASGSAAPQDDLELSGAAVRRLEGAENGAADGSSSVLGSSGEGLAAASASGLGGAAAAGSRAANAQFAPVLGAEAGDEDEADGAAEAEDPLGLEREAADREEARLGQLGFGIEGEFSGQVPGTENVSPLEADARQKEEEERAAEAVDEAIFADGDGEQGADVFGLNSESESVDPFGLESEEAPNPFAAADDDEQFAVTLGYGMPDIEHAGIRGALDDEEDVEAPPIFGSGGLGQTNSEEAAVFGFSTAAAEDGSLAAGVTVASDATEDSPDEEAELSQATQKEAAPVGISTDAKVRIVGPPSESLPVRESGAATLDYGQGGERFKTKDSVESVFGATGNVAKVISAYLRQSSATGGTPTSDDSTVSVQA